MECARDSSQSRLERLKALKSGFFKISYFTILKINFIYYIVPLYNTPNISNSISFVTLFKYSFFTISLSSYSSTHRSLTTEKKKNTETQNGVDYLSLQTALTAICNSFFPLLKPIQLPCFLH